MSHYYSRRSRGLGARRLISDHIRGVTVEFVTVPGVFSPNRVDEGTKLLIEHARIPEGSTVLDLGCGYGAIGITIARAVPGVTVYMVDINSAAAKLARLNARLNGVEDRVKIAAGDLYAPVSGIIFDVIVSNPPLSAGMDVVKRLVEEAPRHLRPGGTLQLVVSQGAEVVESAMRRVFGNVEILATKKGYRVLLSERR